MRLFFNKKKSIVDYKSIDFSYNNVLFEDIFDLIVLISKKLKKNEDKKSV